MQTPGPLFTLHTLFRCWFALNCAINEMNWRGKNQINRNKMITNASYIIIDPVAKRKMERKGGKKRTHWSHNNSIDFHNLQSSHVLFRCDYTTFFSIIFSSSYSFHIFLSLGGYLWNWYSCIEPYLYSPYIECAESWMKSYKLSVSRLLDSCSDQTHSQTKQDETRQNKTWRFEWWWNQYLSHPNRCRISNE